MTFPSGELKVLMAMQGIGPQVIQRLECIGIDSCARLKDVGVDVAVEHGRP